MPTLPGDQGSSPLLSNALEAIENGMEDFASGRDRRMSSALRNLCAGVLLLLKEKLRQLSPPGSDDSLIFKTLVPKKVNESVVFVGKGKKTVDLEDIRERLTPLGFAVDWRRVYSLRDIRNSVEHHQSSVPLAAMQQAISDTFSVLVRVFEELRLVPARVLSEVAWTRMLQESEAFRQLESDCRKSRESVVDVPGFAADTFNTWLSCPACDSELMKANGPSYDDLTFTCAACGENSALSRVMEVALENQWGGEAYIAAKEGCELPIGTCPSCNSETFVVEEDVCYVCGEGLPYKECSMCGTGLSIDEQDLDGLCGYCQNLMSKDD